MGEQHKTLYLKHGDKGLINKEKIWGIIDRTTENQEKYYNSGLSWYA